MHIGRMSRLVFLMALFALLSFGCGGKPPVPPSDEVVKASKAIGVFEDMEKAYKARDYAGVTALVSPDFKPGNAEFLGRVRRDIETYGHVGLDLVVERVEEAGDETRVVFHWRGSWRDKEGHDNEGRGNSVFVFKDDGKMSLIDILGDSPFGVVR